MLLRLIVVVDSASLERFFAFFPSQRGGSYGRGLEQSSSGRQDADRGLRQEAAEQRRRQPRASRRGDPERSRRDHPRRHGCRRQTPARSMEARTGPAAADGENQNETARTATQKKENAAADGSGMDAAGGDGGRAKRSPTNKPAGRMPADNFREKVRRIKSSRRARSIFCSGAWITVEGARGGKAFRTAAICGRRRRASELLRDRRVENSLRAWKCWRW